MLAVAVNMKAMFPFCGSSMPTSQRYLVSELVKTTSEIMRANGDGSTKYRVFEGMVVGWLEVK